MNDWLKDRIKTVLVQAAVIDKFDMVDACIDGISYVHGYKNNEEVAFAVWYDLNNHEWKFERREL